MSIMLLAARWESWVISLFTNVEIEVQESPENYLSSHIKYRGISCQDTEPLSPRKSVNSTGISTEPIFIKCVFQWQPHCLRLG